MSRSRRVALAALFSSIIFISKTALPSPFDKTFVIVQAFFLGLGTLMLAPLGATLIAFTAGLLTAAWRAPMAIYTVTFAVVYGLLVDGFCYALKARSNNEEVRRTRFIAALTVSTVLVGMASYYTTVHLFQFLPRNLALEMGILVAGTLSGLAGGYLGSLIWRKYLQHLT